MGIAIAYPPRRVLGEEYDLAIIGAGPVGLALAIETARAGISTLVLDRRPPLAMDAKVRPQLLVARAGDLAHLVRLGVDTLDPRVVSRIHSRCEGDLASGRTISGVVQPRAVEPARDLWALASQPPFALVPIGRLQQALLVRAEMHGATVAYGCEVTRVRRHARSVSLQCADGTTARAAMVVIATGAARPLIASMLRSVTLDEGVHRRLIAGLFATAGKKVGTWTRQELPIAGFAEPVRCTVLQTPEEAGAGTALLVDPRVAGTPSLDRLHQGFATAARAHGLADAPTLLAPIVFTTSATTLSRRVIGGDGRAPIVIAGDAAQTGHVFSGQTCFINVALALVLADQLRKVRTALQDRLINAPELLAALASYDDQSAAGAGILARNSLRHTTTHPAGAWALAGVARA